MDKIIKEPLAKYIGSYNRNTKQFYSTLSPIIGIIEREKIDCPQNTREFVQDKVQELVSKWFTKMNQIELNDISENPLKIKITETKMFSDNTLKSIEALIYIEH